MTQDELAEQSGLSRSSLIAIEKGRANLQWILL
ncbi:helix-turn-helix domain-containing protein [uncultured Phascolarctobacterium sp.]